MKAAILVLAAVSTCEAEDPRYDKLAARVTALEGSAETAAREKETDAIGLDGCMTRADRDYWAYVHLNARKTKVEDDGITYRAPATTWDTAARNKANAIEACKALWKK